MKKYIVESYDHMPVGSVIASNAISALSIAKMMYQNVIAPMVYEVKK